MKSEPFFATETNLSKAWAAGFCRAAQRGVVALAPLVVSIADFDEHQLPCEDQSIRDALERELDQQSTGLTIETVAGTIFPHRFWQPGVNRAILFDRYRRVLPKLHRDRRNQYGLYFERMIAYPNAPAGGNQLEHILACYHGVARRKSALQAALFDPVVDLPMQVGVFNASADHTKNSRRGFPCMQQVAFAPNPEQGTLGVSAFFASQYLFARGYGNYLGVCRLGRFIAHEMGLRLERVTCYVGYAQIDTPPGRIKLQALVQTLGHAVPS